MDCIEGNQNGQVLVTVDRSIKITHFSDGIEEEIMKEKANELNRGISQPENSIDPNSLSWGPWLSHYAWKSGSKMLNVVDYAGEGLANFFGITTPKYQLEISEHERLEEEKKKLDDESAGWVPKNSDGDIPLVLNEPLKEIGKP